MDDKELQELLLATFAAQAVSITDQLRQLLDDLRTQKRPLTDQEAWAEARRHAHTIKGAGRAVGLEDIERAAHGLEKHLGGYEQDASAATAADAERALSALAELQELIDACVGSASSSSESARVQPPGDGRRGLLLVADDSRTIRDKHLMSLSAAGYQVLLAEDGEQAWNLLINAEDLPRAVISDVEMPNLDGIGLVRRIRSHRNFEQLPVVIVTTLESEQDRRVGLDVGADHYLPKSAVGSQLLLDVIEALD